MADLGNVDGIFSEIIHGSYYSDPSLLQIGLMSQSMGDVDGIFSEIVHGSYSDPSLLQIGLMSQSMGDVDGITNGSFSIITNNQSSSKFFWG